MSIQSIIRGSPLFNDLYDSEIDAVLSNCGVITLAPGEKLFDEGDKGEDLYLIISGKIEVIKKTVLIATLNKGDILGELILLYEGIRSTEAVAIAHTDLLVLNYRAIINMYDKNPRAMSVILLNLCRLLADRLKKSNAEVRDLRLAHDAMVMQMKSFGKNSL